MRVSERTVAQNLCGPVLGNALKLGTVVLMDNGGRRRMLDTLTIAAAVIMGYTMAQVTSVETFT